MSWTTLGNGVCPPPPPEGFRWVKCASGQTNQAAIDNSGRLYTWGAAGWGYTGQTPVAIPATDHYLPNALIPTSGYSNWQLRRPTQVGTKSDWIDVQISEYSLAAQDAAGYVYVWGDVGYFFGSFSHPELYDWYPKAPVSGTHFDTPGSTALTPKLIDNTTWKSFVLGWYHILLQKQDNSLWTCGYNYSGSVFGNPSYIEDAFIPSPVEMTWIPANIKLFDADLDVSVVITTNNEVWAWGEYSTVIYATPTQIPFSVPAGQSIVEVRCSWEGICIRLSNGRVYAWGENFVFDPAFGTSSVFVADPNANNFTQIDCYHDGAIGLSTDGNLLAWGSAVYLGYQPTPGGPGDCDYTPDFPYPTLTAASLPNQRVWIFVAEGGWTHLAIDNSGRLFSWGENAYSELGVGLTETELDHACLPIEVLPPVDETGTLVDTAESVGGSAVARIPIPRALQEHIPCGHWHVRTFETSLSVGDFSPPYNCWECAGAVDGYQALIVLNGRHRPNELIFMSYDIQKNQWGLLYSTTDVNTADRNGSAAILGEVHAFHGYGYTMSGTQFQQQATNPCFRTYVQLDQSMEWTEWFNTLPMKNGRNKLAINRTGVVVVIVMDSLNIRVEVSTNYGVDYTTSIVFPKSTYSDCSVIIDSMDDMYLAALNESGATMLVYRSVNNGASWTLQSTTPVVPGPSDVNFSSGGGKYVATVGGSGGIRFYDSTAGCAVFNLHDLNAQSMLYAAHGTAYLNLAAGTDYYTSNYEASPTVWKPLIEDPLNPTTDDMGTLSNSADNALYTHSQLRDATVNGPFLAILISTNLGQVWRVIRTPFNWCATYSDILKQFEDPVWPFVKQTEKIGIYDPVEV